MGVNHELCEQIQAFNQSSIPVSTASALQKCPNENLGQSYVLCHSVPKDKQDGAGPIVICARCFTLIYQRAIFFKPTTSEPLDYSVSREIKQAFASPSPATNLQSLDKGHGEGHGLKSSVAELVQDEAFPATVCASNVLCNYQRSILPKIATEAVVLNSLVAQSLHDVEVPFGGCVTCNFQNTILPKPFPTRPCDASVPPSNSHVFQPACGNSEQTFDLSVPHVKIMAEVGDGAAPFVYGTWDKSPDLGRGCLSCCEAAAYDLTHSEAAAYDLTHNKLHSTALIDRCNLMEQQSSRQGRPPLTGHCTGLEGPNVGITSPTLCNQIHGDNGPLIINVPKCISIRADSHTQQVKIPSCRKNDVKVAFNTTGIPLLPIDHNKPYGHRRQGAYSTNAGMYKTEMCNKWLRSMGQYCPYGEKCQFAHGSRELRPVLRHRRYKTILCRMVAAGEPCHYEHRCHFRHVIYPHEAEVLTLKSIPTSASSTSA